MTETQSATMARRTESARVHKLAQEISRGGKTLTDAVAAVNAESPELCSLLYYTVDQCLRQDLRTAARPEAKERLTELLQVAVVEEYERGD